MLKEGVNLVLGSSGSSHSYSNEEKEAFVDFINNSLAGDQDLKGVIPISLDGEALFQACKDGILLSKLINAAVPDTIDERALSKPTGGKPLDIYRSTDNLNLAINSASAIGCTVVNIHPTTIYEGRPHIISGLVWQIIKVALLANIDLTHHPELFRLLEEGEDINDLLKLTPEKLLMRWLNYHLKNAGSNRRVKNWGTDLKDSEVYTIVMNQLDSKTCNKDALNKSDLNDRARMVLDNGTKLGCKNFIRPRDIVNGNTKLNMAFVAQLFNKCPGLEPLKEEELKDVNMDWNEGQDREARQFALWINSLGIEDYFCNNLYQDLRDGLGLIKVIDAIEGKGFVDWKKVDKNPNNKFKKVANNNYAVDLGHELKFSLVNIQGSDIVDGNKTLTLGFVWQLMRHHVIKILKELGGGKKIEENEIISWANNKVKNAGKNTSMANFGDTSLKNSLFFIDLLFSIREKSVKYELVNANPSSKEDFLSNAKYAISVARTLGCLIFVLPDDIIEVNKKMILTFVGAMMQVSIRMEKNN
eukprot:TRINITY_DN790_c0_g1_i1.p1 TRINITY_DN790_c0_g1~~TRINITY_DN790_c0_g1_i1.p1  ORF type:complete len:529 (-),score=150.72 TRINITY_DN790_c0_g1_i1:98-1684(-)